MLALPELIESGRVTCRSWRPADQSAMAAAVASSIDHLRPWLPFVAAEPLSVDQRLALIEAMAQERAAGDAFHYGIFRSEPATDPVGPVLGGIGLHRRHDRSLEVGYWIRADQTGKGLASEVVEACLGAVFDRSEIVEVELHHDRANAASGGVARSCGFEFVGEGERAIETEGETGVDWAWRMTRQRWLGRRSATTE